MIQSLRNVMIEGTEMLFEFTESALEEVRQSHTHALDCTGHLTAPPLLSQEEWLEPFEVVPELAECSCAVYPTLDDGDTASVDDIVAETSSVGTKQSDTQPTRAARPAGRRSFITRSMRRPGEESGAAMPGVMPSLSEREEYAAPESEAATPEAAKGPQAPLTPEERLERFARWVRPAGAAARPVPPSHQPAPLLLAAPRPATRSLQTPTSSGSPAFTASRCSTCGPTLWGSG